MTTPIPHAEFIKAFADGRKVQFRYRNSAASWLAVSTIAAFAYANYEFRLAPEPRVPEERWVNRYDTGLSEFGHRTREQAVRAAISGCLGQVLFREVIEENDK